MLLVWFCRGLFSVHFVSLPLSLTNCYKHLSLVCFFSLPFDSSVEQPFPELSKMPWPIPLCMMNFDSTLELFSDWFYGSYSPDWIKWSLGLLKRTGVMLLAKALEFKPKLESWISKSSLLCLCRLCIFKLSLDVQGYFSGSADISLRIPRISEQMTPRKEDKLEAAGNCPAVGETQSPDLNCH